MLTSQQNFEFMINENEKKDKNKNLSTPFRYIRKTQAKSRSSVPYPPNCMKKKTKIFMK